MDLLNLGLFAGTTSSDVCLTMPSTGMSLLPSVLNMRSAALRGAAPLPGFERSTARSCAKTLLVTSTTGTFSLSAHSTCSISAPYFGSRTFVPLPLVVHWLPSDLNQSFSFTDGSGIQACVFPSGLAISSRVTIWKLRQAPGCGANAPCDEANCGRPAANVKAAPVFKKSRLSKCIMILLDVWVFQHFRSFWTRLRLRRACR
jgi:hypothetical protein